jgi:hypothetical protein
MRSKKCAAHLLGYADAVDADLSKYFLSIPHDDFLKSVARRVVNGSVLPADQVLVAWQRWKTAHDS